MEGLRMKKLVSLILISALMMTMISCGARPEQVASGDVSVSTQEDSSADSVSGPRKKLQKPILKFSGWTKPQKVIVQTMNLEVGSL